MSRRFADVAADVAADDRGRVGSAIRPAILGLCLAASLALYAVLAVVLGSVPAGWNGVVGFSLRSAPLFRAAMGVPVVTLSPAGFARAVAALLILLWLLWGVAALVFAGIPEADRRRWRPLVLGGGAAMLALVVVWLPPVLS